jgi:hypothetical protein
LLEPWTSKNKRRVELINKEFSVGLTEAEARELAQLQGEIERYLDGGFPLPFELLKELRGCAREEGLSVNPQDP